MTENIAQDVRIEHRFCGPPGIGNGGIVCSLLAEHCGPSAEITLRKPAPLATPMQIDRGSDGVLSLCDGDETIATGRETDFDLPLPIPPTLDEAREAARCAHEMAHPYPKCFVCGPDRAAGDGLRAITGSVAGRPGMVAAPFTPNAAFVGADGRVPDRFIWAALDCPGGIAAMDGRDVAILLGRFSGRVERPLLADEPCLLMGWILERNGRKCTTGTALLDSQQRVIGRGLAVWIDAKHAA